MITIIHEIRHHERNFSLIAEDWPEADAAARALNWLRAWVENHGAAPTRVLHFAMAARQKWAGEELRLIELEETEAALGAARLAGLPAFCEQPPLARRVNITADDEDEGS